MNKFSKISQNDFWLIQLNKKNTIRIYTDIDNVIVTNKDYIRKTFMKHFLKTFVTVY